MKKSFLAGLAVILLIAGLAYIFFTGSESADEPELGLNNTLLLNIDGYVQSCMNEPSIYVEEHGTWIKTNRSLPGKGMYFLDGKYIGYGMCDVVVCNRIQQPFIVKLIKYNKSGEKESLETAGLFVPEYESVELKGRIKVELNYFSDDACKEEKTFSRVFEIR